MSLLNLLYIGKNYNKLSEEELVEDCVNGIKTAQEYLTDMLLNPIYRFFLVKVNDSIEAEDLTQDTFTKILKSLESFSGKSAVKTWAISIAKYTWFDYLRNKYGSIETSELDDNINTNKDNKEDYEYLELPDEEEEEFLANLTERVNEVLTLVKPEYAEILKLRYLESLTFKEIGEILGIEANNAKVRHKRALDQVKEKIKL